MKTSRTHPALRGFTLIELLVVIAIIAILAGLLLTAGAGIRNKMIKNRAQAELQQVALAINAYKSKLGYYPPDNRNNYAVNSLLYELIGCTNINNSAFYPFNGFPSVSAGVLTAQTGGGITGIMNSMRGGTSPEDGGQAVIFLKDLKPANYADQGGLRRLGVQLDGPGNLMIGNINPFRYNSSNPTNNPTSFDLWVDIIVAGKTNRISNWGQGITPL